MGEASVELCGWVGGTCQKLGKLAGLGAGLGLGGHSEYRNTIVLGSRLESARGGVCEGLVRELQCGSESS